MQAGAHSTEPHQPGLSFPFFTCKWLCKAISRMSDARLRHGKPASAHSSFDLAGADMGQGLSVVLVSTIIRKVSYKSRLGRHLRTVSGKGAACSAQVSALQLGFIRPSIRHLSPFSLCTSLCQIESGGQIFCKKIIPVSRLNNVDLWILRWLELFAALISSISVIEREWTGLSFLLTLSFHR